MNTWRTHPKTRSGRPTAQVPPLMREQFLAESAAACRGFKLKMAYAAKIMRQALQAETTPEPRGLQHPDERHAY